MWDQVLVQGKHMFYSRSCHEIELFTVKTKMFCHILLSVKWKLFSRVLSDSLQPHGLYSPWNSPGLNTGVDSLSLLQGIFLTQGLNLGFPHCRQMLYHLSYQESPWNPQFLQAYMSVLSAYLFQILAASNLPLTYSPCSSFLPLLEHNKHSSPMGSKIFNK